MRLWLCQGESNMTKAATGQSRMESPAAFLTPDRQGLWAPTQGMAVAKWVFRAWRQMALSRKQGAAQYSRDVRVTADLRKAPNGIQAMDLVGRKMMDAARPSDTSAG